MSQLLFKKSRQRKNMSLNRRGKLMKFKTNGLIKTLMQIQKTLLKFRQLFKKMMILTEVKNSDPQ